MTLDALQDAGARLRRGDVAGALASLDAVLADARLAGPLRAEALKLRSQAHEARGDLQAAIADLEGAVALAPGDARAHNELGIVLADAGQPARAIDAFTRAVVIDAAYARAWNNLGNAERAIGHADAAERAFERATRADPAYALAHANLGAMRRERGDDAGAEAALLRALQHDPVQRVALLALAGLRRQQGSLDEAASLYGRAAERDSRDANARLLRAQTLAERDDLAGAHAAYDDALARDPAMLRAALGRALTLPMVPVSAAALASAREDFGAGLARLEHTLPARAAALAPSRALDELRWTNFLLAYQGGDDLALQSRYGDLVQRVVFERAPEFAGPAPPRPPTGRQRVAFVSAFFRDGTAGRYFERWITDLPRERFEVDVYQLNVASDALTARLRERADRFHAVARMRPSELAPRLRAAAHDVIVYPELGMDATTFALATLRLAPRQCAGWGHPVTTGLPTIDAFFTSGMMEPPDGSRHYRERLVPLPGLGTRYAMPVVPAAVPRDALGLPADVALLLCPQSLFKVHPDDDRLFARVLAAAPGARLVVFDGRHPALTATYLDRLTRACEAAGVAVGGRVHVLPPRGHADYLLVNRACDVMLDTLHWSGGNTSLDAIACGLPIVTRSGRFMRGRQSAGMLGHIGLRDAVAADEDDYVARAAALASDASLRAGLRRRIEEGRGALFDDAAATRAFADALATLAQP
jgi:CRISPR-associated protein Csy1